MTKIMFFKTRERTSWLRLPNRDADVATEMRDIFQEVRELASRSLRSRRTGDQSRL